jgi:flagellar biosynthesis protein FlhB
VKKDDPWHRFARMFTAEGMDESLRRTFIGRAISMVSFIMVILCLGLWVTVFSLWRDNSLVNSIAPKILSNLMCFGFFGGLVFAVIIGGLVGNTLRRVLWKMLVKREKQ